MPYWQLFYHIVWATKNRTPMLTSELEQEAHALLRTKAISLHATVFALNGMPDHVHLIAAIPPKIAVATFIGQLKGSSSARLSKDYPPFAWQEEYSVFSFDKKRLPHHVHYVERQKMHHAEGTAIPALERTTGSEDKVPSEGAPASTDKEYHRPKR